MVIPVRECISKVTNTLYHVCIYFCYSCCFQRRVSLIDRMSRQNNRRDSSLEIRNRARARKSNKVKLYISCFGSKLNQVHVGTDPLRIEEAVSTFIAYYNSRNSIESINPTCLGGPRIMKTYRQGAREFDQQKYGMYAVFLMHTRKRV